MKALCPEKKKAYNKNDLFFKQRLKCLYDLAQSELYVALASEVISNPVYLQTASVLESLLYTSIKLCLKLKLKKKKKRK